jgi:hypothetical protein
MYETIHTGKQRRDISPAHTDTSRLLASDQATSRLEVPRETDSERLSIAPLYRRRAGAAPLSAVGALRAEQE